MGVEPTFEVLQTSLLPYRALCGATSRSRTLLSSLNRRLPTPVCLGSTLSICGSQGGDRTHIHRILSAVGLPNCRHLATLAEGGGIEPLRFITVPRFSRPFDRRWSAPSTYKQNVMPTICAPNIPLLAVGVNKILARDTCTDGVRDGEVNVGGGEPQNRTATFHSSPI